MLSDRISSKNKEYKEYSTPSSSVFRVSEIYENAEYNESGEKPVFIRPEVVSKKK